MDGPHLCCNRLCRRYALHSGEYEFVFPNPPLPLTPPPPFFSVWRARCFSLFTLSLEHLAARTRPISHTRTRSHTDPHANAHINSHTDPYTHTHHHHPIGRHPTRRALPLPGQEPHVPSRGGKHPAPTAAATPPRITYCNCPSLFFPFFFFFLTVRAPNFEQ